VHVIHFLTKGIIKSHVNTYSIPKINKCEGNEERNIIQISNNPQNNKNKANEKFKEWEFLQIKKNQDKTNQTNKTNKQTKKEIKSIWMTK